MSYIESTLSENLNTEIPDKPQKTNLNLISRLSLTKNTKNTSITLILSFAYSNARIKYTLNTPIINLNRISLNDTLNKISKHIPLSSYSISYADNINEETPGAVYFYCGIYPFSQTILCELTEKRVLWLKLRQNTNDANKLSFDLLDAGDQSNDHCLDTENKKTNYYINTKSKRAKERTIVEVIKKVYLWVKLLQDIDIGNGRKVKLTALQAANHVRMSKKSLDDYYQHLKLGKSFGFNFNQYMNDKAGVLRGFVKSKLKGLDSLTVKKMKSKKEPFIFASNEDLSRDDGSMNDIDDLFHNDYCLSHWDIYREMKNSIF